MAARAGRIEEAGRIFATVSQSSLTVQALETAAEFFRKVGNEHAAQTIVDRKLAILRDRRLAAHEYMAALNSAGFIEEVITHRLAITPPQERQQVELLLRRLFGDPFKQMMLDTMADHFTLGELRALTRFYTGEAATIAAKMGEFMGRVLPGCIERVLADAGGPGEESGAN